MGVDAADAGYGAGRRVAAAQTLAVGGRGAAVARAGGNGRGGERRPFAVCLRSCAVGADVAAAGRGGGDAGAGRVGRA